jgi:hypothetical protein
MKQNGWAEKMESIQIPVDSIEELEHRINTSTTVQDINSVRFAVVELMKTKPSILKMWQDKYWSLVRCPTCGKMKTEDWPWKQFPKWSGTKSPLSKNCYPRGISLKSFKKIGMGGSPVARLGLAVFYLMENGLLTKTDTERAKNDGFTWWKCDFDRFCTYPVLGDYRQEKCADCVIRR